MVNPNLPEQSSKSPAYTTQTQTWKWEKKHWLLVIAVGCIALWWFGSSMLEVNLVKKTVALLPVVGGLCFAADSITKLI